MRQPDPRSRSAIEPRQRPTKSSATPDVTDKKPVEAERAQLLEDLRLSEHHLAEAQRIAHIGSWEQDLRTGSLWWSDEACRIIGVEPGTFAGTLDTFLAFVHPDDRATVAPGPETPFEAKPHEAEYRIIRADGTVRDIHEVIDAIRDADGVPIRYVGTIQGITEQVTAERERTRLAWAVEQTADSIWMQDVDNIVTYVNRSFSRVYGYEPAEIVGRHAQMIDSGQQDPSFFAEIWAGATAGKTWTGSIVNRRKDGTLFEVEAVISGVSDASGRLIGYAEPARQALIAGMGYFAVKRGLRLVAEGIETKKELETLRALAVSFGQGYLLGRPQDGVAPGTWPTRIDLPAFPQH